jgi:ankyrin repeat protein
MAWWLVQHGANPKDLLIYLPRDSTIDKASLYLSLGADVNYGSGKPLGIVLKNGNLEAAKFLVSKGANVNLLDNITRSKALIAANSADALSWLYNIGARPELGDDRNIFLNAVTRNDLESVKFLLGKGFSPNVTNYYLQSALHIAILNGNLEIALLLMKNGADLFAKDANDRSIYCYADCQRMREVIRACEHAGAVIPCLRSSPCP